MFLHCTKILFIWVAVNGLMVTTYLAEASTLNKVKNRGELICGVAGNSSGMSFVDEHAEYKGMDVDFCKAIAVAILGDKDSVDFVRLSAKARFTALIGKEIDVLSRNSTWNYFRDTKDIEFVGINFYDGQSFLARSSIGIRNIAFIPNGTRICVEKHTTTERGLKNYFSKINKPVNIVSHTSKKIAIERFFQGDCELFTGDTTDLLSIRTVFAPNSKDYVIFDEQISKEPLGPAVRDDDQQWINLVRWIHFSLIMAEEKGITSSNIDSFKNTEDPSVQFLLGIRPGIGRALNLNDKWFYRVIKAMGNYGEIYNRNFGAETATYMKRGLNALWTDGGLMYSPPLK